MADNIVFLEIREQDGFMGRSVRIAKARSVAHDLQARKLEITDRGLTIVQVRG
jgi:KaiC/GvpD/RAD55 family RecA-like ATPase